MSRTVIIKPTHECNLGCEYCYVGENKSSQRISTETLENSFQKLLISQDNKKDKVEFIWHGGEPLTMGLDFFKQVSDLTEFYRKQGHSIRNSIQTNGTLLSEEAIDYLTNPNHEFSIGLSLDGPKEIHDKSRHFKSGRGSFDLIWENIQNLKKVKKRIGAISVISKLNINSIEEIYNFFKENGISLKANPLITSGNAAENIDNLGITPVEYGKAMVKLFDLWFYDTNPNMAMTVDNLDSIVRTKLTRSTYSCSFSGSCQESFLSIDPKGDVYPCGRFDETTGFKYGNINTEPLETITKNSLRERLLNRSRNIESCLGCEYGSICNSGCVHNAYMAEGNIEDKDVYCPSYKMIFEKVFKSVKQEIDKAKTEK